MMANPSYLNQYWIQISTRCDQCASWHICTEITDSAFPQLSMQQAVLTHFPKVKASYRFTNRTLEDTFTRRCFELFKKSVQGFLS